MYISITCSYSMYVPSHIDMIIAINKAHVMVEILSFFPCALCLKRQKVY